MTDRFILNLKSLRHRSSVGLVMMDQYHLCSEEQAFQKVTSHTSMCNCQTFSDIWVCEYLGNKGGGQDAPVTSVSSSDPSISASSPPSALHHVQILFPSLPPGLSSDSRTTMRPAGTFLPFLLSAGQDCPPVVKH